jgi:hypothetical protein
MPRPALDVVNQTLILEPCQSCGAVDLLLAKRDTDAIKDIGLEARSGSGETERRQHQIAFAGGVHMRVDRRRRLR